MLGQTCEYALRVMVFLAANEGQPVTTRAIATGTLVPEGYLAKILQTLSRAGFVKSQRGLHGGSVLRKAADDITLLEIVQAINPLRRIETCPLALAWHGKDLCPLHRRLDEAIAGVETVLRNSTIADLLVSRKNHRSRDALCPQPTA